MLIAVLLGFVFAPLWNLLGRWIKGSFSWLPALLPAGLFLYFASLYPVTQNGPLLTSTPWIPSMGVNLDFRLDGLSLLFALLITGIGTGVFIYASYYLKGHRHLDRFFAYISFFMASMLGVVLADNLLLLIIFWELTSISSYFLIGFDHEAAKSRRNALQALVITGLGGFLLLAGFVLIGTVAESFSIAQLLGTAGSLQNHPLYGWMLALVCAGAFTKSAQFPFHFWLPGAMAAPTPVSAYLHSATMVKAGVYLLARFTPMLGGTDYWQYTLISFGGITMLYSAFHAMHRKDLKEILAYSTVAALGMLVFLLGIGTQQALLAAGVFILTHALYKATLFLVAGMLDHETGTRHIEKLRGLRKVMWPVAIAGGIAALSSAGVPLTYGFIGKDLIYDATLKAINWPWVLTAVALVTNILVLYAGFQAGIRPFTGPLPDHHRTLHLPNARLWLPACVLALLCLAFGILPALTNGLAGAVASAIANTPVDAHLAIWHGFNTVLALSGLTLLAGFLLYGWFAPPEGKLQQRWEHLSPESLYRKAGQGFTWFAGKYTRLLHNGNLRSYVFSIITFIILLLGTKILTGVHLYFDRRAVVGGLRLYDVVIFVVTLAAIWKSISTNSRITAVASLGVVGYCICLLFVIYSAPDLAMTQFTIDTLTVVLFVLVLFRLPRFLRINDKLWQDGILAALFGGLISLIALGALNEPTTKETSEFYAENAYLLAKGKNIVNVMLVDFRGFDTMIEITVLSIAALGVYSLMKLRISSDNKE
ncbi:putative monovalent cation/H+ antiporter subunit A [Paraflavitalea pollutisoli]|uniref:putative monovalent cation/H+ antiporter subunit A n=1 Tax=Paraflavitalea pollutisoli TaxID=3034143 RepID=UPI0023EB00A7|nr:putative monovalent cation/H+ antiporter subunit A [Paraflavitalea sp. H1-2-19X]